MLTLENVIGQTADLIMSRTRASNPGDVMDAAKRLLGLVHVVIGASDRWAGGMRLFKSAVRHRER
jgi:hypothetical protein